MKIWLFKLQHSSVLKAQSRQRKSNIYIYLYVCDQSVYTGSEITCINNESILTTEKKIKKYDLDSYIRFRLTLQSFITYLSTIKQTHIEIIISQPETQYLHL